MGLLKKISIFILSFLLVVESQGFSFYLVNTAFADEFDKAREDCAKKTSKAWDGALNRCITKQESYESRQSFRACEKEEDYAKQRECFDKNAADMIGDLSPKKAGLKEMQKTAEALGYIQMIIEMIAKDGANAKCMSSKVMAAAGIVGMGVDIYLSFFVEDELHELQDKYAKNITKQKQLEKGTYEAQIEAFNYLQKEQETLISVDEKKIIAYGLMTGLNGIAMLLAIYEMTPFGAAGACTAEAPKGEGVDIPDAKVAKTDVDTPDVDPTPPDGGGPPPGGDPKKKGTKFKEVATDVKTKKSVIDAFPPKKPDAPPKSLGDIPIDTGVDSGPPKSTKFKDTATDVKTKSKVIDAFGSPDKPPTPPRDPPSPPKKPSILDNPPGDIPPAPKAPEKPPKAPEPPVGDPPRKVADPGDPPPAPGKPPKDPGDVPPPKGKDVADPGPPPKRSDFDDGLASKKGGGKAPEAPTPPTPPEKPAGGPTKAAGGGDYVEANIETTKMQKKDITAMSDADIDSLNTTRANKDSLKKMRAEKQQNLDNIKTQQKKYGKDHNVDNLTKRNKQIDQKSFDIQNKSQIQDIAGGRKAGGGGVDLENYNKQKAKYDADMDTYKQKKAEYDSYQSTQKSRVDGDAKYNAAVDNHKAKQQEFNSSQKQKLDYENYKQQKAEFDNYQKQKADYDSYSSKKAEYDSYAADSSAWNQKNKKYEADLEAYNQKQQKYDADMDKYNKDYDTWQNQKSNKDTGNVEYENAKKQYDSDLAKYDADMDSWTKEKKQYEIDRTNYNAKKAEFKADVDAYKSKTKNEVVGDFDGPGGTKKSPEVASTKVDPGPPPSAPKRPDILNNPPGDIPPPPKKPVDPGYMDLVYSDPPELPPSKLREFPDFPRGGKAPELPPEPPRPPKGAADPGAPPPKTRKNAVGEIEANPDYQKWEIKNEKFEARKKAVPEFNEAYKKWEMDKAEYKAEVQKYRAEVDAYKRDLPPAKKRELDGYTAELDAHNKQMSKTEQELANFDDKWMDYENQMDKYKTEKYEWQKQYGDSVGGGDPAKKAEFDRAQKKYDQDTAKYDADMESWTAKKKQAELDRINKKFGGEAPDADDLAARKKAELDRINKKFGGESPDADTTPKKSFKDAAEDVKTKKEVIDGIETYKKEPVPDAAPPKDVAAPETPEAPKAAEAPKTPEAPKAPEEPKSTMDKVKEGFSKFLDWFRGSSVGKGAKFGTKVIHIKTQFYKGGKEVEYCDTDLEEDCEEKKTEVPQEEVQPKNEREKSKVKENPNESNIRRKKINFDDPNEVLSSFLNHKFEDKGLVNIEDALILEEEWKNNVSGGVKSPSIEKYRKMQESGLFGENPFMANILHNILISYRKMNLANSLFPEAVAQDTTTTSTPGAVSDKPKNTWEEETDDEEDAANKKARQEQKGKDAGIMLGSAGAGMIGGALVSAGLDKLGSFRGALGKLGKVVDKVRVFFGTSPGIAILSGMSTAINGLTLGFVVMEKKEFEENVKKIKDIKSKFEESMADSCPAKADRETQSKPQCYCYTMGSSRNNLRKNSDICKSYWARFDGSFFVGAGEYEFKGENAIKGCVGLKGNYDFDCSCRKYKDRSTGSNACMKVNNSFEGLGAIGSSNSVGVLTSYANDIASDPATIHRLDGDAVGRNAVKMKQASEKALLAFNKQRASQGEAPFVVGPQQLEAFTNKVMALPESRGAMQALQEAKSQPARPPMAMPKDLKLAEEKKVDLSKITYESTKKKTEEKKEEAKAKAPDWDFLAAEKKEDDDPNFMDKSFDFNKGVKKNEIVEKSDTSIFDVISTRYLKTGLKLLFEEHKK